MSKRFTRNRQYLLNMVASTLAVVSSLAASNGNRPPTLAVSDIRLSYTCGNYFRIQNANSSEVDLTFKVHRTGEHGTVSLPGKPSEYPYSEIYVLTRTKGSLQIYYNGSRVAVKPNGGLTCPSIVWKPSLTNPFVWRSTARQDAIVPSAGEAAQIL
jgi:hypothetical protein